jgi:hypothetical protein
LAYNLKLLGIQVTGVLPTDVLAGGSGFVTFSMETQQLDVILMDIAILLCALAP